MKKRIYAAGVIALGVGIISLNHRTEPAREMSSLPQERSELAAVEAVKTPSALIESRGTNLNEKWSFAVPEMEVEGSLSKKPDYKRTYSIQERELPRELLESEGLNPKTPEGLKKIQEAVGLNSPSINLAIKKSEPIDTKGIATTRLNVFNNGLQMVGSEVILNQSASGSLLKEELIADVIKDLPSDAPTRAAIPVEDAFEKSTLDIRQIAKANDLGTRLLSSRLVYFPGENKVELAWHVVMQSEAYKTAHGEEPQGRWNYFIDAANGVILDKMNEVHTIDDQASGAGGNGVLNVKKWDQELDVVYSASRYEASTNKIATYDLKGARLGMGTVLSGTNLENFGSQAGNNAHGYAENTLQMLQEFGYNSIDDSGMRLKSRVNYGVKFANAFWDGFKMTYGDGGSVFFNMSSDIGVVAHEINHGFTDHAADLVYSKQPGALNESFSDLAGVAAKFFVNQAGANFLVGEKIIRPEGSYGSRGFLRNMCEPKLDGVSIDSFLRYRDTLDVHQTSGIMNKAFCRFAKRLANSGSVSGEANREAVLKAAKVFFVANKKYWTSYSSFRTAASGTMRAARSLLSDSEVYYLKKSWNDVHVVAQ